MMGRAAARLSGCAFWSLSITDSYYVVSSIIGKMVEIEGVGYRRCGLSSDGHGLVIMSNILFGQ
jgi:hypothetical protein